MCDETTYNPCFTGLSLELYIQQIEYIGTLSPAAGVRVLIHPRSSMPFPEDQGISIPPGYETSIGIRKVRYYYYYTILYYTIPYHTIPYHIILYYTILYYTIPYHTIPYHTILYYIILLLSSSSFIIHIFIIMINYHLLLLLLLLIIYSEQTELPLCHEMHVFDIWAYPSNRP